MKVFLNGEFIEKEKARVSVFDHGFLYGQGLFETMRAYNRKIFRVDSHIERLFKSAPIINLGLPFDRASLKSCLAACLEENDLKDAYVRLTVWQAQEAVNFAVFAKEYSFPEKKDYEKGARAIISCFRQDEFSPLSRIKSSNYLHLLLAYQEAKKKGMDEAILLNSRGFVCEASRANIFIVKDNCLLTPSLDCGCLPGIARDTLISIAAREKIETIEAEIAREDLGECQEAFLTNSLIEVMPLVGVDSRPVGQGFPGKITEIVLREYKKIVLRDINY